LIDQPGVLVLGLAKNSHFLFLPILHFLFIA
jgi:hypothetical protein